MLKTRKTLCQTLLFAALLCCGALSATAAAGDDWYKYPTYGDRVDDVVETPQKVYYLSSGNLFSFAPDDQESYAYHHLNKLNDNNIKSIHYNHDKKYLLVVYEDSNLDIIFDNGRVVNMPDIKDASIASSKSVNDVAFGSDRIAIATDFGLVVYNDDKCEVIESGIYHKSLRCVAIMGGNLLVYGHENTGYQVLFAPLDMRHNSLDKFKPIFSFSVGAMEAVTDDVIAIRGLGNNALNTRKIDFENCTYETIVTNAYTYDAPLRRYTGGCYSRTQDQIVLISAEGVTTRDIPALLRDQSVIAFNASPTTVWCGDPQGIAQYDISQATPTVLHDKMLYPDYATTSRVGYMKWSADSKRLYVSNYETSINRNYARGEGSTNYQTTNIVEGTSVKDVSLKNASAQHYYSTKYQKNESSTRMYGDPLAVVEDPDDPTIYYCASNFEGVYVIKRNPTTGEYEEIGKYNGDNSSITDNWGPRTQFLEIDRDGNLWVGHQYGSTISVLPAQKRRMGPENITASDWMAHPKLEETKYGGKDFMGVMCRKSNMVFYATSLYQEGFMAIDTKGTYDNLNDDVVCRWPRVTDQDGKEVNYNYITFFLEDNRGCVWVGTSAGIFEITDPSKATGHDMRVRRIKVPRNDGTNYADYLLESEYILWMALDPAGRKWVATENSGIYLVSETGDKIIYHFNEDNSPLINNLVTSIECDRSDNTVYVGTCYGLYSFNGDASPAREDFSEIYAYPNPVRPEYSGIVTITGLMDNSVVKITDSMGSVVYETRSEGGMATWDTSTGSDGRVKSGVYYVYASQSDANTSTGAVTKILVIN